MMLSALTTGRCGANTCTTAIGLMATKQKKRRSSSGLSFAWILSRTKTFWALAAKHGLAFVHYLRAFKAMRDGDESGNFI